jgi:hypothetical protein
MGKGTILREEKVTTYMLHGFPWAF